MDRIIEQIPCVKYKIQRAECLAYLGRYQDAQEVAKYVFQMGERIQQLFSFFIVFVTILN